MTKLKYSSLLFVSQSEYKYCEYCRILGINDLRHSLIHVLELQSLNLHVLVENKIDFIKKQIPSEVPFFVEHTGLIIESWKGLPGGLTSVFMDTVGNEGICKMLKSYKGDERNARAKVVIGYYYRDHGVKFFEGETLGKIAQEPCGKNNFGWDPIFIPNGDTRTYGEMTLDDKNQTSMRIEVTKRFQSFLDQNYEL